MGKGEKTRQRIVAAAAPLFNQRGFEGCSMQQVLDATGLEKGGVYRHFGSKEELAAEAFRFASGKAVKIRTDGLEHVHGARAKLSFLIQRFVEEPTPMAGGCPLLNTAVDADDGNPTLRRLVRKAFAGWRDGLAAIVEQGVAEGEFRAGTSARQVSNTIMAALEGAVALSRIEGDRTPLKDAQQSLETLLDSCEAQRLQMNSSEV